MTGAEIQQLYEWLKDEIDRAGDAHDFEALAAFGNTHKVKLGELYRADRGKFDFLKKRKDNALALASQRPAKGD